MITNTALSLVVIAVMLYALAVHSGGLLLLCSLAMGGLAYANVTQRQHRQARTLALEDLRAFSPRDLEHHVAAVIGSLPGWSAEATRGGGDQGADVIAGSSRQVRVAIQVKHYTGNVGNKAAQEIVAAKALYRAMEAVVLTSGPDYTRAAQELAWANGVKLWGPGDLLRLQ